MEHVFCMNCGQKIAPSAQTCPHCGAHQNNMAVANSHAPLQASAVPQTTPPPTSVLPEGIKGWSWGAFWFSWIWAIFNKTWIGLLALIPLVNLVMMVVLGLKGREWAWQNKTWTSVEHFKRVQKKWDVAGWIIIIAGLTLGFAIGVFESRVKHHDDTNYSVEEFQDKSADKAQVSEGSALQPDPPAAQVSSHYQLPPMQFEKVDLLGAMRRGGFEQNWITYFTKYLIQPDEFWQECVYRAEESGQRLGGMGQQEAHAFGEQTCQDLTRQHRECLIGKNLDDAVLCLQTYINNVSENGE
ncbi:MAG: zinc ribbon domain-containing protein [Gallionella sp.]|nr:zinc ribbon domain-containing protein [Gallionella sp.]MDD4947005.1 zinc ribbon domain-containing protein [Gallionella sp.]